MVKTPDRIWLINMGDEVVWCDCPDPSPGIDPIDVVEYVRALSEPTQGDGE